VAIAKKVWSADEVRPPGELVTNLKTVPSQNWLREEPRYAAELYALERGEGKYIIFVDDEDDHLHRFVFEVKWSISAVLKEAD
jgi:hypothetical protein